MPQAMNDTLRRVQQQLNDFSVAQRVIGALLIGILGERELSEKFERWTTLDTRASSMS